MPVKIYPVLLVLALTTPLASAGETPKPGVYFISPTDGAVLESPFTVRFGLRDMGVAPAGLEADGTGHHHLLIDLQELPPMNLPLPKSSQLLHFGGGQTETELSLPPGEHRLQLLLGNYLHVPHDPPVLSEVITITVKDGP